MTDAPAAYRIYADLADWWPLISPPHDYTQEAAYLAEFIQQTQSRIDSQLEVLDLGSGGGHLATHLKERFALTLVDISSDMLKASQQLNPECEHLQGDMRTVRLGRRFDVVLVHDAVDYILGVDDLRQVIETAAEHCRPEGVALFVPDHVKDTFREYAGGGGGGVDAAGRTASFTEHTWDPDPADDWVQADYEFVLREATGAERVITESHRLSAYRRATWHTLLDQAGLHLIRLGLERGTPGRRPANLFAAMRRG